MNTMISPATRTISRRSLLSGAALGAAGLTSAGWLGILPTGAASGSSRARPAAEFDASVALAWIDLQLRLIQHTPGYTPPVASRAIACSAVALYEAVLPGMPDHVSLATFLGGRLAVPARQPRSDHHWPTVANASLASMTRSLFPTATTALLAEIDALEAALTPRPRRGIIARSIERGRTVAAAVDAWARTDGGHEGYLRNFPADYVPPTGPGLWVPTPPAFLPALQPQWGANRPMIGGSICDPGPHPAFSTVAGSDFAVEAEEVYETVNDLTAEQAAIAAFWSDDPGTTATPPGHSLSILRQVLATQHRSLAEAAEVTARLGIAVCDAFIACWRTKYQYNLVRPITYIRAHIDPAWGDPLPLTTPPFPEYTSGHSVQSGAAAEVLTDFFGSIGFTDHTHDGRGLPSRSFGSFREAADEAAISRLYGGIHYRSAIDLGLAQGRCIGRAAALLPLAPDRGPRVRRRT